MIFHRVVIVAVRRQDIEEVLVQAGVVVRDDGGGVGGGDRVAGGLSDHPVGRRLHGLEQELLRSEARGEDSPQCGHRGRRAGGRGARHHQHLLLGSVLGVGQGGDLVVLQGDGSESLQYQGIKHWDSPGVVCLPDCGQGDIS